jgi:hypothetical protein
MLLLFAVSAYSQSEKVEINNPIYGFLDRLYIKGVIKKYPSMSYPLSRGQITKIIEHLDTVRDKLNGLENATLDDLLIEFEYDLYKTDSNRSELFGSGNFFKNFVGLFSDDEKFLYVYHDDANNLFVKSLLEFQTIVSDGDDPKGSASLFQWGVNARGTMWKNLGYGFSVTNGQVIGDMDIALEQDFLVNNYKIHEEGAKNFDFTEGYISYDNGNYALQAGRQKVIFGNGYDEFFGISPTNAMDFIKFEISFGPFNYTFMHNWLLSKESFVSQDQFLDIRVITQKYLALHRFGVSLFNDNLDLGFSEMIIYSERSPEIAYMTPFIFYKSVEHSLQDRDNAIIMFDATTRLFNRLKLYGTFVIDELDFAKLNTNWWGNMFAYQAGFYLLEPIPLDDLDVYVEYTKILPYTFSHRTPYNNYTHYNSFIGANMHPNSDKIKFALLYGVSSNISLELGAAYSRHGLNIYDEDGDVIRNVGGDIDLGHRNTASDMVKFLDGDVEEILSFDGNITYEIFNNVFLELNYSHNNTISLERQKQHEINFVISINY